jgi:hypothetical protein
MFCEQLDYNLSFRWFLDLIWDEPGLDHSTCSRNRAHLLEHDVAGEFFPTVVAEARERSLTSDEHFTVDGTLIEAWARSRVYAPKAKSPASARGRITQAIERGLPRRGTPKTRPTSRLIPKRGWRRRALAERPGSVPLAVLF